MRVAVVGHGPSLEGKGLGPVIDAHDCVIRMWDCHWQTPGDYGEKYDIGLFTLSSHDLAEFRGLCKRWPANWWAYDLWEKGLDPNLPKNSAQAVLVDHTEWRKRAKAKGGKGTNFEMDFTRGSVAALNALETLQTRELTLFGFDDVFEGYLSNIVVPRMAVESYTDRRRKYRMKDGLIVSPNPGAARTDTHDFECERDLIREIAKAKGMKLTWCPQEQW